MGSPQDFSLIDNPPRNRYKKLNWEDIMNQFVDDTPQNTPFTLSQIPPIITPPSGVPASGATPPGPVDDPTLQQYSDLLKSLMPAPTYDSKRDKRFGQVAMFQAIGNALANIVNAATAQGGTPIIKTDNRNVFKSLEEQNQMRDRFQLEQNQYRNQLGQMGITGVQMARGDKQNTDEMAFRSEEAEKSRTFSSTESEKQRTWSETQSANQFEDRKELIDIEFKNRKELSTDQLKDQKELEGYRHGLAMDELDKRLANDQEVEKIKGLFDVAKEQYKDSFKVVDPSGKEYSMPPSIYWDVARGVIKGLNAQYTDNLFASDYNAQSNAIKLMVAEYWPQYYQVDANGNWSRKSGTGTAPSQSGTNAPAEEAPDLWN